MPPRTEIKNETISLMQGKPTSIVLVPLHNMMVKEVTFPPRLVRASYRYDFDEIEDYFYRALGMNYLPFHYFCGIIEDDYTCMVGCPLSNESCFMDELCKVNAVKQFFQNSIVVALQDDFRIETVDRRMMAFLSNYLISPLMRIFNFGLERVYFFDETLILDWRYSLSKIKDIRRRFNLEPSKYFDKNMLMFQLKYFLKR